MNTLLFFAPLIVILAVILDLSLDPPTNLGS